MISVGSSELFPALNETEGSVDDRGVRSTDSFARVYPDLSAALLAAVGPRPYARADRRSADFRNANLAGANLACFNPEKDADGTGAQALASLVASALEGRS